MYLEISKQGLPYHTRILTERDIDDLCLLYKAVRESLSAQEIFRLDSRDYLMENVSGKGRTVGAFDADMLIGYASVRFPGSSADNLSHDVPALEIPPERVAVYDGSAVHPQYRGGRIHQHLNRLRFELAVSRGYTQLMGTVSPPNIWSLNSHLSANFLIKAIRLKYSGWVRFVIHCDTDRTIVPYRDDQQIAKVCDIAAQLSLLERGFWGYCLERRDEKQVVRYGRCRIIGHESNVQTSRFVGN